ncbi:MAG: hypothetical protein ACTIME_15515 [Cellulosimicrobium funkei]|uniref:Uncharacterized protein n=1 Tax=Cellulosimicrobium cellulans TaxID=1710 RepID=A0AAV5P736_CELCE|nr:hypothetical protein [Cellulosimicrobium cellulans]QDP74101.1 hypothetical protein FOG94_02075 [Cellulosimicrobium cellulans]GLY57120.1 hypothetical protein Ccel01_17220 [Cellulosimicrobium cellulans]
MSRDTTAPTGVRVVDARLHLLSRQVLDVDGEPVTTVDDLELVASAAADDAAPDRSPDDGPRDAVPGEPAEVGAVLTGPVLVTRLLGGRPPASRWERVPWSDVGHVGTALELTVRADSLDLHWTENWLREHVVGRIPGGRHDPEEES